MPRNPTPTELPSLTKRAIVTNISKETGFLQAAVTEIVQLTLNKITDALSSGRTVEFRNFGVFEVKLTKARIGRNPKKPDKEFKIPARATVKFRAGKVMRQRVLLHTGAIKKK